MKKRNMQDEGRKEPGTQILSQSGFSTELCKEVKNSENKLTTATTICLNQRKETNILRNAYMD